MKEGRVTYGFPEQMTGSAAVLEKKKKEKKKAQMRLDKGALYV